LILVDLSSFTFLWWAKKSRQKTQPCAAAIPAPSGFRGGVKNLLDEVECRGLYCRFCLSQALGLLAFIRSNSLPLPDNSIPGQAFPHGNPRLRAASQWAKNLGLFIDKAYG